MNRTGFADGKLSPIIYFEAPNGWVELAPKEKGDQDYYARKFFQLKYEPKGWQWREAGTLAECHALEKRLIEQETKRAGHMADVTAWESEQVRRKVQQNLYSRLLSADATDFEKEFIRLWFKLRDDKRAQYENRLREHNWHLRMLHYDSTSKPEDQIPGLL